MTGPTRKMIAFLQQARVDVVRALAASALLDHHGDQPQTHRFVHLSPRRFARCVFIVVRIAAPRRISRRPTAANSRATCAPASRRLADSVDYGRVGVPQLRARIVDRRTRQCAFPSVRRTPSAGPTTFARAEHPVDDVVLDRQRLEFVRAARASRSASARRLPAARTSARLPAPAPSPAPASRRGLRVRTTSDEDQSERDAALGAGAEHLRRELDVLGLHALLAHIRRHPLHHVLRLGLDERLRQRRTSACCRSAAKTCSFTFASILRFSSSLRFDAISALSSSTLPLAMPNAARTRRRRRARCRASTRLHRQRELGVLAGDFLAVIVGGKRERERLASRPALIPATRGFELRQHPPSPRTIAKSLACPPGNSTPSVLPVKSTITRSPRRRRARQRAHSACAAGAASRSCGSISSGPTSACGRSIVTSDRVADLHFRIDLEDRREFELVGRGGVASWARCADCRRCAGSVRGSRRRRSSLTASEMTSERTCGPYCCATILQRHLAGTETRHLRRSAPAARAAAGFRSRSRRPGTDIVSLRSSSPRVSRLVCIRVESLLM